MSHPPRSSALPTPTAPLRVVVVDDTDDVRATLVRQLGTAGLTVVGQGATAAEAIALAGQLVPDAVLLDLHLPDGLGSEVAEAIGAGEGAPAVVICTGEGAATVVASPGVFAVLCKPAGTELLGSTIRVAVERARELAVARADAAGARRQLEERKVIERAKGILMRRTGLSEQEAYRILQRSSQDKATPMIVLAQAVLDSEPGSGHAVRA